MRFCASSLNRQDVIALTERFGGQSRRLRRRAYPPDTFGLADQAKIEGLNVKAYYSAVGTDFEGFSQKFGAAAENVLGAGGAKDSPEIRAFYKRHKEITGVDAHHWGSLNNYAMLQSLTQSIEAVGAMDRDAIANYFRNKKFTMIVGEVSSQARCSTRSTLLASGRTAFSMV